MSLSVTAPKTQGGGGRGRRGEGEANKDTEGKGKWVKTMVENRGGDGDQGAAQQARDGVGGEAAHPSERMENETVEEGAVRQTDRLKKWE